MKTLDLNLTKYSTTFQIGSFDTDLNGNAKITSICNYLQEIAGKHVDLINQGIDDLKSNNLAWVLSRLILKIDRLPKWKEEIEIETWSTGTDGLFGNREFRIVDSTGKTLAIAGSSWLVINITNKRPVRPHKIVEKMPINPESPLFDYPLPKITINNDFDTEEEIHVQYSDIDINQHVNNVKFVEWVIDSCPIEFLTQKQIRELEINFMHEAKLNETLSISKSTGNSGKHHFLIRNKESKTENCRAIITWN